MQTVRMFSDIATKNQNYTKPPFMELKQIIEDIKIWWAYDDLAPPIKMCMLIYLLEVASKDDLEFKIAWNAVSSLEHTWLSDRTLNLYRVIGSDKNKITSTIITTLEQCYFEMYANPKDKEVIQEFIKKYYPNRKTEGIFSFVP